MRILSHKRQAMYISSVGSAVRVVISLPFAVAEDEAENLICERFNSFYSRLEDSYLKGAEKYAASLDNGQGGRRCGIIITVSWDSRDVRGKRAGQRIEIFRRCELSAHGESRLVHTESDLFSIRRAVLIK